MTDFFLYSSQKVVCREGGCPSGKTCNVKCAVFNVDPRNHWLSVKALPVFWLSHEIATFSLRGSSDFD